MICIFFCCFQGEKRGMHVRAAEDTFCELFVLRKDKLDKILQYFPDVHQQLVQRLSELYQDRAPVAAVPVGPPLVIQPGGALPHSPAHHAAWKSQQQQMAQKGLSTSGNFLSLPKPVPPPSTAPTSASASAATSSSASSVTSASTASLKAHHHPSVFSFDQSTASLLSSSTSSSSS